MSMSTPEARSVEEMLGSLGYGLATPQPQSPRSDAGPAPAPQEVATSIQPAPRAQDRPSVAARGPVAASPQTAPVQPKRARPIPDLTLDAGLPANPDAEKTILGAVLLDNAAHGEAVKSGLKAGDFALDSHRRIWRHMTAMLKDGRAVDYVTLSNELIRRKETESVGGLAYVASLTENLPRLPRVSEYAAIVKARAVERAALKLCESITARVGNGGESGAAICAWAAEEFSTLAEAQGPDGNGLRLLHGPEIVELEQPMILPDHLPDHTAVTICARPGDGKTTVSLLICADLSNGRTPYTGTPCPPRNILIMSNEDSPARIRKLFTAAGGNVKRLRVENCDALWQLPDLARLEKAISANAIGCVVVDSLASHSGKSDLNSHQDTMQLLVPLRALAEKYRCLILVIHHLNKSLSIDHINKVAGSIGIVAAFRHNLHVCVDPENPDLRLLLNGKSNLIAPNIPALRFRLFPVGWAGESRISIDDIYRITEPDEKPGKSVAWLREALADGEWHDAGKLQQQATQGFDLSRRSIFRAADTLCVERRKTGFGGRAEWRLLTAARETNTEPGSDMESSPPQTTIPYEPGPRLQEKDGAL